MDDYYEPCSQLFLAVLLVIVHVLAEILWFSSQRIRKACTQWRITKLLQQSLRKLDKCLIENSQTLDIKL